MPQATTVPGWTGPGEVVAAVALATGVGGAGVRVVSAVGVGTLAVVAVGTLAVVGVAPLPEQAATVASSPPMMAALVILNRASVCPIISTPPVGTQGGAIARRPRLYEHSRPPTNAPPCCTGRVLARQSPAAVMTGSCNLWLMALLAPSRQPRSTLLALLVAACLLCLGVAAMAVPGNPGSWGLTTAGTFAYRCAIHPQMKATVIVTP